MIDLTSSTIYLRLVLTYAKQNANIWVNRNNQELTHNAVCKAYEEFEYIKSYIENSDQLIKDLTKALIDARLDVDYAGTVINPAWQYEKLEEILEEMDILIKKAEKFNETNRA